MRLSKLATTLAGIGLLGAVTVLEGTPSTPCKGDACGSVLFEIRGGCFTATNLGGKPIAIAWGGHALKVGAGESKSVTQDGQCVHDLGGPLTATFG